jgi:MraZ protein
VVVEVAFQGTSALALDGKGRVTIPVRHREQLTNLFDGKLTLTRCDERPYLTVYPRPVWETERKRLMAAGPDAEDERRFKIGNAVDVEIDSGARVLISPELRAAAKLDKDVVLVGTGEYLELWDKQLHADEELAYQERRRLAKAKAAAAAS